MQKIQFTIEGTLPDLNNALEKAKIGNLRGKAGDKVFANPYQTWKKKVEAKVQLQIQAQLAGVSIGERCGFLFRWFAPNRMKDPDNIAFAKKFILDAMQAAGVLPRDSWRYVGGGFADLFEVDASRPRVEVTIYPLPEQ